MDKKSIKIFLTQLASIMIIAFLLFKWQNSIEKGTNAYTEWMNDIRENISDNVTSSIEINSLDEWNSFVNSVYEGLNYENCKVILNTDIDFKGRYIRGCIGSYENPFKGIFDGNNHAIKNINISSGTEFVGLFGYTQNAVIENLTILNENLYSNSAIATGGIAGYSENGTILNCRFDGTINIKSGDVGGIVGNNLSGLSNCKTNGTINSVYRGAGGIAGDNKGTIYHCENNMSIYGENLSSEAGGIVGYNCNLIESCVNYGNIKGGGIVEWNRGIAQVRGCFNFGNTCAGIVHTNSDDSVIEQCVNYGKVFGRYASNIVFSIGQGNESNFDNKVTGCLYLKKAWTPTIYRKTSEGEVRNNYGLHQFEKSYKKQVIYMLKKEQFVKAYRSLVNREIWLRNRISMCVIVSSILAILLVDLAFIVPKKWNMYINYKKAINQKQIGNYENAVLLFEKYLNYKKSKEQGAICLKKYIQWKINNKKNIYLGKYDEKNIEWIYITGKKGEATFLANEGLFVQRIHNQESKELIWGKSELYQMLNEEWKKLCFNAVEQEVVCEVTLITVDDVNKYLTHEQRKCKYIFKPPNVLLGNRMYVYWWIRNEELLIDNRMPFVTSEGLISKRGKQITFSNLAIRPMIKVSIRE